MEREGSEQEGEKTPEEKKGKRMKDRRNRRTVTGGKQSGAARREEREHLPRREKGRGAPLSLLISARKPASQPSVSLPMGPAVAVAVASGEVPHR